MTTVLAVPDDVSLLDLLAHASIEWGGVGPRRAGHGPRLAQRRADRARRPGALRFIFNAYWEPLEFALPVPGTSTDGWRRLVDTSLESPDDIAFEWDDAPETVDRRYRVEARSVVVLAARRAADDPAGGRSK